MRQFAKPLGVSGDGDPAVGKVEVVQGETSDGRSAGGVDGGQGDDQPLRRGGGDPLDGEDLGVVIGSRLRGMSSAFRRVVGLAKIRPRFLAKRNSERSAAIALRRCHPRRGDSTAVTSVTVISGRCPRVAAQFSSRGRTQPK